MSVDAKTARMLREVSRGVLRKVEGGYDWETSIFGFPYVITIRREGDRVVGRILHEAEKNAFGMPEKLK